MNQAGANSPRSNFARTVLVLRRARNSGSMELDQFSQTLGAPVSGRFLLKTAAF